MDPYTLYLATLLVALYVPVYRLGVHSGRRGGKAPAADNPPPDDDKPRPLLLNGKPVEFVRTPSGRIEVRVNSRSGTEYLHNDGTTRLWSIPPWASDLFPSHDAAVKAVQAIRAYTPHV